MSTCSERRRSKMFMAIHNLPPPPWVGEGGISQPVIQERVLKDEGRQIAHRASLVLRTLAEIVVERVAHRDRDAHGVTHEEFHCFSQ